MAMFAMLPAVASTYAHWWKIEFRRKMKMESNAKKTIVTVLEVLAEKIDNLEMMLGIAHKEQKRSNRVMDEQARELKALRESEAYAALLDIARAAEDAIKFASPLKGKLRGQHAVSLHGLKDQIERWHAAKSGKP